MKTKIFALIAIALISFQAIFAQIPPGYYDNATGTGATLKTALYNIIKGHTDKTYNGLYACYVTTDNLPGNKVFDMYSIRADSTANYWYTNSANSADQCGNYNEEGDCYNREHSMPQSWFNEASPMKADLFHVYPTDGKVNGIRSSFPYGKVGSASTTSTNGSKLGSSDPSTGYSGTVFEPIDVYKGDFARTYFYMATRYETIIAGWSSNGSAGEILAGNSFPAYKTWFLNLMIQWHIQDTISEKEIRRNNAVHTYQHNRNPYIDHPEYVITVWGVIANNITIQSQGNATEISTQGGTLQMSTTILPNNATIQSVNWSVINETGNASITTTGLLTAIGNGTVTVKATAKDGSGVFGTKQITISNQTVGIDNVNFVDRISVYPNPANDILNIDFKNNQTLPENILISDISGKIVYKSTPSASHEVINTSILERGVYFIKFTGNQSNAVIKFVH